MAKVKDLIAAGSYRPWSPAKWGKAPVAGVSKLLSVSYGIYKGDLVDTISRNGRRRYGQAVGEEKAAFIYWFDDENEDDIVAVRRSMSPRGQHRPRVIVRALINRA